MEGSLVQWLRALTLEPATWSEPGSVTYELCDPDDLSILVSPLKVGTLTLLPSSARCGD